MPGSGAFGVIASGDEPPWPAAYMAPWIEQVIDLPGRQGKPFHRRSAVLRSNPRRLITGAERPSACVRRRPLDLIEEVPRLCHGSDVTAGPGPHKPVAKTARAIPDDRTR